ncbi:MFS transporter [Actinacidiphila rubida]|uniref:Predicted arabinose efflux permease, MFS family n=1 Tax=Actinacidiphila rubida TaxID=310780 RepID=A0A1H8UAV5_9ACTN|nr:MFS transporter [Actinacidiphila rubida]SEO99983.1 Predicted arabinose efflux permease, MFS family [Actinacidiphila rubida]
MLLSAYRGVLGTPGAAPFFLASLVGRLGVAMTSLGLFWLLRQQTGSFATAGLVTGAFAVAEAVAGPQAARLIDRFGQCRVLPAVLAAHAAAVAALVLLAGRGAPGGALVAAGVLVGATIPQLGALSAARWVFLLQDGRAAELPTAYALESLANAGAYLAGPALVGVLGAAGHAVVGTAVAGAAVVAGGLALAAQRASSPTPERGEAARGAGRFLLRRAFAVVVGVNVAIGGFFGSLPVAVTAFAVDRGTPEAATVLLTVSNLAGVLVSCLYGWRRPQWRPAAQLAVVTLLLGAATAVMPVAGSALAVGAAVAVTGSAVPVILILCTVLARAAVERGVLTQAFTWLNSFSAAGSACAAAACGRVVEAAGAHAGFAVVAVCGLAMAVAGACGTRAPDPTGPPPLPDRP